MLLTLYDPESAKLQRRSARKAGESEAASSVARIGLKGMYDKRQRVCTEILFLWAAGESLMQVKSF